MKRLFKSALNNLSKQALNLDVFHFPKRLPTLFHCSPKHCLPLYLLFLILWEYLQHFGKVRVKGVDWPSTWGLATHLLTQHFQICGTWKMSRNTPFKNRGITLKYKSKQGSTYWKEYVGWIHKVQFTIKHTKAVSKIIPFAQSVFHPNFSDSHLRTTVTCSIFSEISLIP